MNETRHGGLDATAEITRENEHVMLKWVFDKARDFYKNPNNLRAFEAWKKNKEADTYGTNHINA
jgi:hypothetical protein